MLLLLPIPLLTMATHPSSSADTFPCRRCGTLWTEADGGYPGFVRQTCCGETADQQEQSRCRTCDARIVASINASNFSERECGECEYGRYRTQPGLLKACRDAFWLLTDDAPENWQSDTGQVLRTAIAEAEEGRS